MSDNISITFLGPTFAYRMMDSKNKNSFYMNLGIGYIGYLNNTVIITNYKIKGGTVGGAWDIGYDIFLSKHLSLGFKASTVGGTLQQYKLTGSGISENIKLDKNEYESLSRIDLSVGLRFNK